VFLAGMEEGLFPHQMSLDEPGRLEEERRLCYVGITRARRLLYLSCAERRRLHGAERYNLPSQFIGEIPGALIEEIRPRVSISQPVYRPAAHRPADPPPEPGLGVGQRVHHPKFGEGLVIDYEGQGSHARVQVNFADAGDKWLVLAYANLQPL
jgi:DNA helicase-2/ATP-dependent DNA helicase PcrA